MLTCDNYELPIFDINGEDAKYSFLCLENGIKIPTREFELLKQIQEGKKSVNLQIKLWAEDIGILLMPDELKMYCIEYPDWIYKSVINQAKKRILNEIGFIPSFIKNN